MAASVQTSWKSKVYEAVEVPVLTRCCFCAPLRPGLLTFAYVNLLLSVATVAFISYHTQLPGQEQEFVPRMITDLVGLAAETIMTVVLIVALHMKHLILMKIYLHFEIVFSTLAFGYSVAFLTHETASEVFVILFQIVLQMYLLILIWSSIKKMERDGTVKYTRELDPPPV